MQYAHRGRDSTYMRGGRGNERGIIAVVWSYRNDPYWHRHEHARATVPEVIFNVILHGGGWSQWLKL